MKKNLFSYPYVLLYISVFFYDVYVFHQPSVPAPSFSLSLFFSIYVYRVFTLFPPGGGPSVCLHSAWLPALSLFHAYDDAHLPTQPSLLWDRCFLFYNKTYSRSLGKCLRRHTRNRIFSCRRLILWMDNKNTQKVSSKMTKTNVFFKFQLLNGRRTGCKLRSHRSHAPYRDTDVIDGFHDVRSNQVGMGVVLNSVCWVFRASLFERIATRGGPFNGWGI